jgi:hypothetical protein
VTVPSTLTIALNGSAGALVAFFIYLVWTGRVITRAMMNRITETFEQRLEEKDEQIRLWHDAHDVVKKGNDALIAQLYQSLEIGRTTNRVLNALPSTPSPAGSGSDEARVA